MGQLSLADVTGALKDSGLRVQRAYPGTKIPAISEPVAAVRRQGADLQEKSETVAVTILSPGDLGAEVCEDAALAAGNVLAALGAICTVGECSFDGRTDLFSVNVTACLVEEEEVQEEPEEPRVEVTLGTQVLQYVVDFTAWRTVDDEVTALSDALWNFQLEEFFPTGTQEEKTPEEPFSLKMTLGTLTESYIECVWIYQKRVAEGSGIRQIRTGIAGSKATS